MSNLRRRTTVPDPQAREHTMLLRPPDRTWQQKAQDFFWDKRRKECLTRSPLNWASITIYYSIFLAVVILIFYISMKIAEAVASRNSGRPQYVLDDSPVGKWPSLNFVPLKGSRNLIWISPNHDYEPYVNKINKMFDYYKERNGNFNPSKFGACGKAPFGYNSKSPCLFFKINRILDWEPEPYTKKDDIPDEVPPAVKSLIKNATNPRIWFTCNGTTAKDRDHMATGFFKVQGESGFDVSNFPFKNQDDFVDPIIAVKINDTLPKKVLYTFTCSIWGKKLNGKKVNVDVNYYVE